MGFCIKWRRTSRQRKPAPVFVINPFTFIGPNNRAAPEILLRAKACILDLNGFQYFERVSIYLLWIKEWLGQKILALIENGDGGLENNSQIFVQQFWIRLVGRDVKTPELIERGWTKGDVFFSIGSIWLPITLLALFIISPWSRTERCKVDPFPMP